MFENNFFYRTGLAQSSISTPTTILSPSASQVVQNVLQQRAISVIQELQKLQERCKRQNQFQQNTLLQQHNTTAATSPPILPCQEHQSQKMTFPFQHQQLSRQSPDPVVMDLQQNRVKLDYSDNKAQCLNAGNPFELPSNYLSPYQKPVDQKNFSLDTLSPNSRMTKLQNPGWNFAPSDLHQSYYMDNFPVKQTNCFNYETDEQRHSSQSGFAKEQSSNWQRNQGQPTSEHLCTLFDTFSQSAPVSIGNDVNIYADQRLETPRSNLLFGFPKEEKFQENHSEQNIFHSLENENGQMMPSPPESPKQNPCPIIVKEEPQPDVEVPKSNLSPKSSSVTDVDVRKPESEDHFLSLRSQLSTILDAFTLITGQLSLTSELAQDLILNHQRQKSMEKTTLLSQLSMIASTLTEFAYSQFLFSSLSREDQTTLLKNNIPLYLQYILARYFSADTGVEQLNWILEGQICIESIEMVTSLSRISLKEYNTSVNLFLSSQMLELFSSCAAQIGLFYPFPQHCNGLIANMLLYYTDKSIVGKLKEEKRIGCIFEEAKELVKMGFFCMDRPLDINPSNSIGPLIHTLSKMKQIFGDCKVQSSGQEIGKCIPRYLSLCYTDAEDSWMKLKLDEFQTAFVSVPPTSNFMEELINLLHMDQPVTDRFMPTWFEMTSERLWRVLKTHPEFLSLSDSERSALWGKNHATARSLTAIQTDSRTTGKDQLKKIVGIFNPNDTTWESTFENSVDLNSLKRYFLGRPEMNLGKWDESSLKCYFEISKDLAGMCASDQVYQLFTLLTLFDTEGLPHSPAFMKILSLRQTYLKFVQRKMASVGCTFVDYAQFKRMLQRVKIFANLLDSFSM